MKSKNHTKLNEVKLVQLFHEKMMNISLSSSEMIVYLYLHCEVAIQLWSWPLKVVEEVKEGLFFKNVP